LRQANIHADPVLLSTREFGFNSSRYPIMQRLNYVICKIDINGQPYYLDASQPLLGFGRLAENCYNGHARIICEKDSGSVYFLADDIKEAKTTAVFIINNEKNNGTMDGSVTEMPGYMESYEVRDKIRKATAKVFLKNIEESYGSDVKVENIGIDSLERLEDPVKIHYDFSFNPGDMQDIIYYNPIMETSFKENPLKAAERKYPVEMLYPIDETYTLNMEIPIGYRVEELPKSVKVSYNGTEGFFEYLIQAGETSLQLRTHIKLNKADFGAEDYNSLREFFSMAIKKQNEQIVFKKKK
jgi:hypothetical protein